MDAKALLKDAKTAIKNKDFQKALRISKTIIREDRNNYMALVFLGLSLQEVGPTDQAPKAFQKAIDLNPSNPLAYQGLISYYEKLNKADLKSELVKAYISYLSVETVEAKLYDYSKKLSLLAPFGDKLSICQIFLDVSKKCDFEGKVEISKLLTQQLESLPEAEKPLTLYEECLNELSSTSSLSETFYANYLTLLNKSGESVKVLEHSEAMYQLFPSSVIALSWICKMFNQLYIEDCEPRCNRIKEYMEALLKIDQKNAMGLFTQGLLCYINCNFSGAREHLVEVTSQRPGLVYAWILLTDVLIRLNLSQEAAISCNKAVKLLKSLSHPGRVKGKVEFQQFQLLSLSKDRSDWEKCLDVFKEKDFDKAKSLPVVVKACIQMEQFTLAESYISELKELDRNLACLYELTLLRKKRRLAEAENVIAQSTSDSCDWWIEVGLVYWDLGDYNKSLEPFLKAAKCDPNSYVPFIHLGHYYSKTSQLDKARRCYEKSFKLNSCSSEAGGELSKIYRKLKNWDANLSLLINLTQGTVNDTNIWAWLQLGLTYLEQNNPSSAVEYLRTVIRFQPDNVHCWESLADAYFSKGAFTSALKCYQKALDLSQSSLYSALQVAYIKKILGEFADAQTDFENILADNSNYVPALKGLSETCLSRARECFNDQRLGTARDYVQISVNKATLAVLQRSELTCLWKLLADCVHFVAKLPEKFSFLKVSQFFITSEISHQSSVLLEQNELFDLAVKFYCKSVNLDKDNPYFWHDLSNCYLNYALNCKDEKRSKLFDNAWSTSRHCTSLNPQYWLHWNLVGVVAMLKDPPNYARAQHSFIKAIIAESNSAVAWTNLGVLYFLMDDVKLANKAFGEGQRSDPNYVNSWIGQALIAEKLGHYETMDLFRHSTQLGQHQQGGLGYAHWVCHMLLNSDAHDKIVEYNIYNMHAIPVASDAIIWYTEKNPDSGCAWNMLGILAERLNLLETAKKAFKHALVLADRKHKDAARVNYARLLYRTGRYEDAIQMFSAVEEATFSSGGGLALALFRNGQYQESYQAYDQALHWLTDEQANQSDLLVALASMAYKFQGAESAQTLLTQSVNLDSASPWSLYATFTLFLLGGDLKTVQLVLEKLRGYEMNVSRKADDHSEFIYHYGVLLSCLYLLTKNKKSAITSVSQLIHKYPNYASTWLSLAQLLLSLEDDKRRLNSGAKCANVALKLGQKSEMDVSEALCVAALSFQRAGDVRQARMFAQKAVHYSPQLANGWVVLMPVLPKGSGKFVDKLQLYITQIEHRDSVLNWCKRIKCSE